MISNVKRYDDLLCLPHAHYLQMHQSYDVSLAVINLSIVAYLCFLAKVVVSECLIEIGIKFQKSIK